MHYFISWKQFTLHVLDYDSKCTCLIYKLPFRTRLPSLCYNQSEDACILTTYYSVVLLLCCFFIVKVVGLSRLIAHFYGLFGNVNHHLYLLIFKCSHITEYLLDKFSFLKHFHKWIKSLMCFYFYCILMKCQLKTA